MSISNSRLAYLDCYKVWDRAIENPSGVRVGVRNYDAALHLRMRLHQARKINRRENEEIYEPGEPLHGCSAYDPFTVRIKRVNNSFYLYIEPNRIATEIIEPLDKIIDDEAMPLIEVQVQKALPAPIEDDLPPAKALRRI